MNGRDRFKSDEIAFITEQLTARRRAERDEQKKIRARLRRAEFHISDWASVGQGFTASDFSTLVRRGLIVRDENVGMIRPAADPTDVNVVGSPLDTWAEAHLAEALAALTGPRAAQQTVPDLIESADAGRPPGAELNSPGLYALYGDVPTWQQLGLGDPPDDRPLYVGKAEDSLVTRDLRTHFAAGKTGGSSPRRSFAALLVDDLKLVAMPRRPADPEPDKWTHYALEADGDQRLTEWMLARLTLAAWTVERPVALITLEHMVMRELKPPLNLTGVSQPWSRQVRGARKVMARAAEGWQRC